MIQKEKDAFNDVRGRFKVNLKELADPLKRDVAQVYRILYTDLYSWENWRLILVDALNSALHSRGIDTVFTSQEIYGKTS